MSREATSELERLDRLVDRVARLPGIGKKSAGRIVYWLLEADGSYVENLGREISDIRNHIQRCRECGNYAEEEVCRICSSGGRDETVLCVVEHPRDVATIETTGEYRGIYHVLHGVLSPLDGIGPEELALGKMMERVRRHGVTEVVVATNPTLEGDSTALYIAKLLEDRNDAVKVSRIASGLPVGGDLEYADRLSVARALRARQNL